MDFPIISASNLRFCSISDDKNQRTEEMDTEEHLIEFISKIDI